MKRRIVSGLLVCLLCLTACGRHAPTGEQATVWSGKGEGTVSAAGAPEWSYQVTMETVEQTHWDETDHRIVASCLYEVPHMKVIDDLEKANKNELHPARGIAQRFNQMFEEWLECRRSNFQEIAAMAGEAYRTRTGSDLWSEEDYRYTDAAAATFWNNGHLACVTMESASFTGGAHEILRRESFTFDLHQGRRVSLTDMVRDFDALQTVVTEEILHQTVRQQKEDDEVYFSDYESVVSEWMSRNVFFGPKGLTVVFDVYDIAPSSSGEQAFQIPYRMVKDYLNDYGRDLLELT